MNETERDRKLRDLLGEAIMDALQDEEERKKPAWASIAASFLDGKGRKNAEAVEMNEYALRTRKALEGRTIPELDTEGEDDATCDRLR